MSLKTLVSDVAAHAGEPDLEAAERLTETVVSALGALLPEADRQLVADELPAPLDATLIAAAAGRALPSEELLVAPGISSSRAHEQVACVCRTLAATLSEDALARLRRAVPDSISRLLVAPSPAHRVPRGTPRQTLAEGRLGSRRPISEAAPERAQSGSVAAANPHAEVKLSSNRGTTQERLHETLAEAGPERSIARRRA